MTVDVSIIISICSAIATISAACVIINKIIKNTITKCSEENIKCAIDTYSEKATEELKEFSDEITKDIEELKVKLDGYIEKSDEADKTLKEGLMVLARDRLNQAHRYFTNKEEIDMNSLSALESLYSSYKTLGGNGFVEDIMKDIRKLERK